MSEFRVGDIVKNEEYFVKICEISNFDYTVENMKGEIIRSFTNPFI